MHEKNETVILELNTEARLRLNNQIVEAMANKGYLAYQFEKLNLGFELPSGWPVDINSQPTLAQLTVFAHKLGLRIVIGDVNLVPLPSTESVEV